MGSVEIQASSLWPGAREPRIQLPLLLGVCSVCRGVWAWFVPLFPLGLCEGWGLVAREKEFHCVPREAEPLALLSGLTWLD